MELKKRFPWSDSDVSVNYKSQHTAVSIYLAFSYFCKIANFDNAIYLNIVFSKISLQANPLSSAIGWY